MDSESPPVVSLLDSASVLKVSSTLEKSTGKKHLIDGNLETCWTSQQGLPQHVQINFPDKTVYPKRLCFTFQGGFVGTKCRIEAVSATSEDPRNWQLLTQVYPEDVNRQQDFDLAFDKNSWKSGVTAIKFIFEESSDFFGRITIYDLKLEGMMDSA
ncbi:galactose-binding domain-like protein [Coprinopsis sp. MPI-PUGE-AT-0042]|nr:galactose-binding domain-like protein [Coprinopsis sp. MPI-PUGE-AT-0042]